MSLLELDFSSSPGLGKFSKLGPIEMRLCVSAKHPYFGCPVGCVNNFTSNPCFGDFNCWLVLLAPFFAGMDGEIARSIIIIWMMGNLSIPT